MYDFLKNKYVLGLILMTLIIFVAMGISAGGHVQGTFIEEGISLLISPVQKVVSSISNAIENSIQFLTEIRTLKKQTEELKVKVDELQEENRRLQELRSENERLRQMLDFKEKYDDYEYVGAQVIAKEPGNWFNTFTIDKGIADGLKHKSVVMSSKGLVGYVYDIQKHSAKVMAIIDIDSSVSTLISRTRDTAVVQGDLARQSAGLCKMSSISKDADIVVGDTIITSGLGGIYPKGLLVGKIKEIKEMPHEISQEATIEPVVDFKRLEEVFVILNTE